jgi:hypothetical protein
MSGGAINFGGMNLHMGDELGSDSWVRVTKELIDGEERPAFVADWLAVWIPGAAR